MLNVSPKGDGYTGTLMYSGRFIAEQPEVARRWMVAYVRAQRDYYDAVMKNGDRGSMLDLLTRYTSLKDRAMLEAVKSDPNANKLAYRLHYETQTAYIKARG